MTVPDKPQGGRRRLWCSDGCRRAAHAERQAAKRAGTAVRVVEVPRSRGWSDPAPEGDGRAAEALLDALAAQALAGELPEKVRAAAIRLHQAIEQNIEDVCAEMWGTPPAVQKERDQGRDRNRRRRAEERRIRDAEREAIEHEEAAELKFAAEIDELIAIRRANELASDDLTPRLAGPNRAERRRAERERRRIR
ncbi:MAG: hypothetical protein K0U84_09970 [Actinomycetia bacterium]|nr:hypothetical protein [Actinomycetes bacterium]